MMIAPALATAWAQATVRPDPWWAHLLAAVASLAVAGWTALMGARRARQRSERIATFPRVG